MGRIKQLLIISSLALFLSACAMKDWIKSKDDKIGVDDFKRITQISLENKKTPEQTLMEADIYRLFKLLSHYKASTPKEQKALYAKFKQNFQQNPTLFDALFLSMIQVTINKKSENMAVSSHLMKAIDMKQASPAMVELLGLLDAVEKLNLKTRILKHQIKRYQLENAKRKKEVSELAEKINALKNIEQSISKREIVGDVQE